jgi:hypothetical protein
MAAEDAAAGGVVTVEASEVDSVGAIMARRLLQLFKTRTSSQLLVGSEISCYLVVFAANLKFCWLPYVFVRLLLKQIIVFVCVDHSPLRQSTL